MTNSNITLKLTLAIAILCVTSTTLLAQSQSKQQPQQRVQQQHRMQPQMKMQQKMQSNTNIQQATMQAASRAYLNNNNIPSSGLALEGYCPVAYFAANKAVKGKAEFAVDYKDVTYYFVNADVQAAFIKNPEKYVPAYGGWCAFGMAVGDKFPVDPTNFKIIDGKVNLFLKNKNVDALQLWNKGPEGEHIQNAAAHWAKVNK